MSEWEDACRNHLAQARTWDMTAPANRWAVRHWARRLWWAKFGVYVSALAGITLGLSILAALCWLVTR